MARASIEVAYTRRWYHGFTVLDNTLAAASDYSQYTIHVPADSRLPGGGNYDVTGLYDVAPTLAGRILNNVTDASNFGNWTNNFNGVDVTLNVRTKAGWTFQGGTSTGQNVADACEVRANLPEVNTAIGAGLVGSTVSMTSPYCHVAYGWLTQLRGLAAYTVPKIDVQVSGAFQSIPGPLVLANYTAVQAQGAIVGLGRPLANNATQVIVNLATPGSLYGDRLNQLDLRVGKVIRAGRTRTVASLDLYNALNGNPILTQSNTYANWQAPQSVLTARFAKVSLQFDF
jgi:hypothetical protein